jgi:hypothetical protein
VAATPAVLREIVERLEEVVDAPLGPELPINPDASLSAVDPDALDADGLEVLNDTPPTRVPRRGTRRG